MIDTIILNKEDIEWLEALQGAAIDLNMDVDYETMRLIPILYPPEAREDYDRTPEDYAGW